jgi:trk/ktr system potassium uptake protein
LGGIGVLAAIVLIGFSSATLAGMIAGAVSMDWAAVEAFALISVSYGVLAFFIYLVSSTRPAPLTRPDMFFGVIVMWLTLVLAAMVPFMLIEKAAPVVAFFEASSAATSLGTTLTPISEMSAAMTVFRSVTAWLGGLLTLMLAVYVLGRYEVGGTPNRDLRLVLHGASRTDPRLLQTFWEVFIPYAAITLVGAAALVLSGVEPVHAALGALNILSTNGFVAWQTQGTIFNNTLAEAIMMVFMMIGASSIIWLRTLALFNSRPVAGRSEAATFALTGALAIIIGLGLSLAVFPVGQNPIGPLFNRAFDIISVLTTTGVTNNVSQGINVPVIFLIGLALIGGSSYSTAGGIKIFRMRSMLHHSGNEIMRLVYPNQILPRSVTSDAKIFTTAKATWSAFFSTIIFVVLATAMFASFGHSFTAALNLSVGAFASVGNLVSVNLFTANGTNVPAASLLGISLVGIVGRVELLVVLAALSHRRW